MTQYAKTLDKLARKISAARLLPWSIGRVWMAAREARELEHRAWILRRGAAALREQGEEDAAAAKEKEATRAKGLADDIDGQCDAVANGVKLRWPPWEDWPKS